VVVVVDGGVVDDDEPGTMVGGPAAMVGGFVATAGGASALVGGCVALGAGVGWSAVRCAPPGPEGRFGETEPTGELGRGF
jgi:hypothetical protein